MSSSGYFHEECQSQSSNPSKIPSRLRLGGEIPLPTFLFLSGLKKNSFFSSIVLPPCVFSFTASKIESRSSRWNISRSRKDLMSRNLAACLLFGSIPELALETAQPKALYRRAAARVGRAAPGDTELARADLRALLRVQPHNSAAQKLLDGLGHLV